MVFTLFRAIFVGKWNLYSGSRSTLLNEMIKIQLGKDTFQKKYLKGIFQYEFDSLVLLIFELFNNNKIEDSETDNSIYQFIKSCSYNKFSEIPKKELELIESYYWKLKKRNEIDKEKSAYLLMSSILKGETLTIIDSELITDFKSPIQLNYNSTISLILKSKFENIKFKTL